MDLNTKLRKFLNVGTLTCEFIDLSLKLNVKWGKPLNQGTLEVGSIYLFIR
jgi:hypothetical protein